MPFFRSLSNELGRNTGKYISNKVFGTGKPIPQYVIQQKERDERRKEREKIRKEREEAKEQARIDREQAREERRLALEQAKLEKEELKRRKEEEKERVLAENRDLFSQFTSYIFSIEKLHTKTSFQKGFKYTSTAKVSNPNVVTEQDIFEKAMTGMLSQHINNIGNKYQQNFSRESTRKEIEGFSVFEKFLVLADTYVKLTNKKDEILQEFKYFEVPKYLRYLRSVKSDHAKIRQFLSKLETYILKNSVAAIDNSWKDRFATLIQTCVKTGKKDIHKKISEKYGANWKRIQEEYNNIDSKHDSLASQIVQLEEQFLGKIRNRSKIKALEEEISNLHKTIPTNGPLINELFEELTSDNKYVEELLQNFNKKFDGNWNELLSSLDKRISFQKQVIQDQLEQWSFVQSLKEGDSFAIRALLQNRDIFEFMEDYGSSVSVGFNGNVLEVDIFPNTDEVVPKNKRTILKNGSLSEKPMPNTEYNLLVQDYICSCILRIANDYFSDLWEESIVINVLETILNSATGNEEENVIVSTQIFREKFEKLNLQNLDASDAVEYLGCNMKFSKAKGFSATQVVEVVQPIKEEEVVQEEVVQEEVVQEEVVQEEVVQEEVVQEEVVQEEIVQEEVVQEEVVQEEIVQEEIVQEEVVQEEVVQEEVVQEEVVQEEIVQEEIVQEEIVQEEIVQEEIVQEEVIEEKNSTVRRKRFKIEPTANVADLNKSLKKFGYQAIVYTAAGNEASDNRKLKTLGGKEYKEINELVDEPVLKNVKALIRKTKVKFKLVKI